MNLDLITIRNLELFRPLNGINDQCTLIQILDETITAGGGRKLRKWMKQPLTDINEIKNRQNICLEFNNLPNINNEIRSHLKKVGDMERILSKLSQNSPADVILMSIAKLQIHKDVNSSLTY